MEEKVFFSIIIPAYNCERFIETSVSSIINQNYEDYEVIIVDDGSTDGTLGVLSNLEEKNKGIKIYTKKNEGPLSARTFGLSQVKAKETNKEKQLNYILFMDSDDELASGTLVTLNQTITKENSPDLVFYPINIVNSDGQVVESIKRYVGKVTNNRELMRITLFNGYNSMVNKAINVDVINEVDLSMYYHHRYGEDLLQSFYIYTNSNTALFLEEPLYLYNMRGDSISHTLTLNALCEICDILNVILERIIEENLLTEEDLVKYIEEQKRTVAQYVRKVGYLGKSLVEKQYYWDAMEEKAYYKNISVIEEGTISLIDKLTIGLFRSRKYRTLNMLCGILSVINMFRRKKELNW